MPFSPADFGSALASWNRHEELPTANGADVTVWSPPATPGLWLPDLIGTGPVYPTVRTGATPSGTRACYFDVNNSGSAWREITMRTPALATAYCSTAYGNDYNNYGARNVTDGATNSGWLPLSGTTNNWIALVPLTPTVATSYTLGAWVSGEMPVGWSFQGSNDRSTWTTLDTQVSQTFSGTTPRTFTFSNSTLYTYYRLFIPAAGANRIGEFSINGGTNALTHGTGTTWMVIRSWNNGGGPGSWEFGTNFNSSHYWYTNNTVYDDYGTNTRFSYTPTMPLGTWRLLEMRVADAGAGNGYMMHTVDGVRQITGTAAARSWNNVVTIGQLYADIAEIISIRKDATLAERGKVTAYLSARYGLNVPGGSYLDDAFPGLTLPPVPRAIATSSSTVGFTTEASEPLTLPVSNTGWCTFTPPTAGSYQIDTVGSSFDTGLAVYTGSALGALTLIASDDSSGATSPGPSALLTAMLADSPSALWAQTEPLGSTAMLDASGNGREGFYEGAILGQPGLIAGDANTAARYSSTNRSATVGSGSWLDVMTFTVEIVTKMTALGTQPMWMSRYNTVASSAGWLLGVVTSGSCRPAVRVQQGAGALITAESPTALTVGSTAHLMFTMAAGGAITLYVNGISVATASAPSFVHAANFALLFGDTGGLNTSTWAVPGSAQYAAFYPAALSPARASAHATAVASGGGTSTPPASKVTVNLVGGTTYRIQVGAGASSSGATGTAAVNVTPLSLASTVQSQQPALAVTENSKTGWLLKGRTTKAFDAVAGG